MITRLDENTAKQRRIDFEKDDAYIIIYDTIDWLSTDYHSLSPEELWQEASDLIDEIRNAPDREWKSTKLFNQLVRKYAELESAKETATIVLYIVTWMLVLTKKVEKMEEHPYYTIITNLLNQINTFPDFDRMLNKTHQDEIFFEERKSKEIHPRDYLAYGADLFQYIRKDLPYQRKLEIDAEIRDSIIDDRPKVVVEKLCELQEEKKEINIPRGNIQTLCKYINERYGSAIKPNSFSNAVETYFPKLK